MTPKPPDAEAIKLGSGYLRGTIAATLADPAAPLSESDRRLLAFHGVYAEADGRMTVRARVPAGRLTSGQYLALDDLAARHAGGVLRLTSRQDAQFHGVPRADLKTLIADIHQSLLTTFGAGGDVARNIMANPIPFQDAVHARLQDDARRLAKLLRPRSRAYRELWLDGGAKPGAASSPNGDIEPIYGAAYLPHKIQIALATQDDNSVDVCVQDLGIVALFEDERPTGYNFLLGGGPSGRAGAKTRLAEPICLVPPDDLLTAVEAVITLLRDHGDRSDRRRGRLATLVEEKGAAWVKARLEDHLGAALAAPQALAPMQVPEVIGWYEQGDGKCFLGVPVPGGRIADDGDVRLRTGLRVAVERYWPTVVLTPGQHVLLGDLPAHRRAAIEADLRRFGVRLADDTVPLERWTMTCPAGTACPRARAEAEAVAPRIIDALAEAMAEQGLGRERVSLRIAGCAAGCPRPHLADIGLIGESPGVYRLLIGGDPREGRLGVALPEPVAEADIGPSLAPLFAHFAQERRPGEGFGEVCRRLGAERLAALVMGR